MKAVEYIRVKRYGYEELKFMNAREKFLETMRFNKNVSPPKWEFGFWGETISRWYDEGLQVKNPPHVPQKITTPTASLFTPAWTCQGTQTLPKGIPVM